MEAKHTATPWYTYEQAAPHDEREKQRVIAWQENGLTLALLGGYNAIEQRANAEFIVRACNAHDDLVASLTNLLCVIEKFSIDGFCFKDFDLDGGNQKAIDVAHAALAKATGSAA